MNNFVLKYERFVVLYANISISEKGFSVRHVRVMRKDMLPIPLMKVSKKDMAYAFQRWLEDRMIPSERVDVIPAVRKMCGLSDKKNSFPYERIMGILSYARNMTDKYWLTPTTEKLAVNLPNCAINGYEMLGKTNYKHMDFHKKNGVAYNFGNMLLKTKEEIEDVESPEALDLQTPDFCTNGLMTKRWRCNEYGFWLEKYFDKEMSQESIADYLQKIIDARQEDREREANTIAMIKENKEKIVSYKDDLQIFPAFDFIQNDKGEYIGYKTLAFTSQFLDLVTLKDMCKYGFPNKRNNFSFQDLLPAIHDFGLDENVVKHKFDLAVRHLGNGDKVFENAGFLVNKAPEREIQSFVAWF